MKRTFHYSLLLLLTLFSLSLSGQNKNLYHYVDYYSHVEGIDNEGFTGLTLEAWVKLDKYVNFPGSQYTGSFILTKEASISNYYGFLLVVLSELNVDARSLAFGLNFDDNGSNVHVGLHSINEVPINEWVHLAATWDGDSMRVYLNGIYDSGLDVSQYGSFYDPPEDSLNIGTRLIGPYAGRMYGYIDEVRIWDLARTRDQLRETMYTELTGNETGLYAYYKLNGSGTTIVDSGPNGFNGDKHTAARKPSTAPLPYYTVSDGSWDNDATWADFQLAPVNDWARVQINNEVSISDIVTVADVDINPLGELTVDATYSLEVDGDMTIKSDNTGAGSFIDDGNLVATQEVIVERYLTQNKWHFIGLPVDEDSAGVFFLSGGSDIYLRTHQEASNTWGAWITNSTTPLIQGRGYEVWVDDNINQDETVVFKGIPNTGDQTTGQNGVYDLKYTAGHGLNLIANPFPSAIMADIHTWTKTNVANSVWVWSGSDGNYLYWTGTGSTNNEGWGSLTSGVIPPFQGFFIEATGADPQLTIPQSSRTHSLQAFYKSTMPLNSIKLSVTGNDFQDISFIAFNENATTGYDPGLEVRKLFGLDVAPQLFGLAGNDTVSIQCLPFFDENATVPLFFSCHQSGWYNLILEAQGEFEETIKIYVEDLIEGSTSMLIPGEKLSFYHQSNNEPGRFKIHFLNPSLVKENRVTDFRVITSQDNITVMLAKPCRCEVILYSMLGEEIERITIDQPRVVIQADDLHGIYVVRLKGDEISGSQKFYKP